MHGSRFVRPLVRGPVRRGIVPATAIAALTAAPLVMFGTAASAEPAGEPTLTVSQTDDLESGETVTVEGSGLDPQAGYYVATCASGTDGPAGPDCAGDRAVPGSQLWVSNGRGATTPIGPDGTFTADLGVVGQGTSMGGTPVDCAEQDCSITLFYDHTNGFGTVSETPVTFTAAAVGGEAVDGTLSENADDSDDSSAAIGWGIGGAVIAVVVIGGIAYAVRRRSAGGKS